MRFLPFLLFFFTFFLCFLPFSSPTPAPATAVSPRLPPELAAVILRILPSGPQYISLFENISDVVMKYVYQFNPEYKAEIQLVLGPDGGRKLGRCLAMNGFDPNPAEQRKIQRTFMSRAISGLTRQRIRFYNANELQAQLKTYNVDFSKVGIQFQAFFGIFLDSLGDQVADKVTACLFVGQTNRDRIRQAVAPRAFDGNALMAALPYGDEFIDLYAAIGSYFGRLISPLVYPQIRGWNPLFTKTRWVNHYGKVGSDTGRCLALNGFKPRPGNDEDPTKSYRVRLSMPILDFAEWVGHRPVNKAVRDQLESRYGIEKNPILKPFMTDLLTTFGFPFLDRIFQCYVVSNSYETEDMKEMKEKINEFELDGVESMVEGRRRRRHLKAPRMVAKNVHVQVDVSL